MSKVCIVNIFFQVAETHPDEQFKRRKNIAALLQGSSMVQVLKNLCLEDAITPTVQTMAFTGPVSDEWPDGVLLQIDMQKDETTVPPDDLFQLIADKLGCTFFYEAEDHDDSFYVNTDIDGKVFDDQYIITGSGFGLDDHCNMVYHSGSCDLIDWFKENVDKEIETYKQCVEKTAAINAKEQEDACLSIHVFMTAWT